MEYIFFDWLIWLMKSFEIKLKSFDRILRIMQMIEKPFC